MAQKCNRNFKSCNNMSFIQQKQRESEGEFQTFNLEVQTINQPLAPQQKTNFKKHPRVKIYSQKQRLGLMHHSIVTQPHITVTHKSTKVPTGKIIKIGSVTFRSNFQSGSIGTVDLVGSNSYEITLDQETNSTRSNIWFYYAVQGVKGQANFTIKGFSKRSSLYNEGMKLCYRDNKQSNKWRRGGLKIKYESYTQGQEEIDFFSLKFSYFFKSSESSSVQFAYSFPYGTSKLNCLLSSLQSKIKLQSLGQSYEGRNIPLVTLGNPKSKQLILVSARVHPGQTCSSFIVQGFLKEIVNDSEHSNFLKENFLIKVIPMINVDGVANGNYRFSAAGVDLNRKWKQPHEQFHPQIFFLKEMILRENKERKVRMFIDLHGHSRKKNVFFYGCCPNQQSNNFSKAKAFPFLMSKLNTAFNYESCSFNIQKDKEGTARVTLFKELKIYEIFTLQASFCGTENGPNFVQSDYQKFGRKLCQGVSLYFVDTNTTSFKTLEKKLNLKAQSMNQLANSSYFLKIGNQDDIGSDSEPEKGEGKPKLKHLYQKNDSKKQGSNIHKKTFSRNFYSLKQKAQLQNTKQVKDIEPYMYLFQPPTQTIDADFRKQSSLAKNQRVHSISKQTRPPARMFSINQQTVYNQGSMQKDFQKTKINLLIGKQGAQYRRVRKIVEASKSVKGSKTQIQKGVKMMPKLCLQQQNKHRKTSGQMFFRKPIPLEVEMQKSNVNVLCRGRQIFF